MAKKRTLGDDEMDQTEHLEVSFPLNESSIKVINAFKVGDIVEMDFGKTGGYTMADKETDWRRFWSVPIRDEADAVMAREIVESHGSCLGWAHAKLNQEIGRRSNYRTVTP